MITISNYVLTPDEKIWLTEVYNLQKEEKTASYSYIRAKTYNFVSKDFNPHNINRRLYINGRLTLLAIALIDPEAEVLNQANNLVYFIRNSILSNPEKLNLDITEIANSLDTNEKYITTLFNDLNQIGRFYTSGTSSNISTLATINLNDEACIDEYISYVDLKSTLEKIVLSIVKSKETNTISSKNGSVKLPNLSYEVNTAFIMMSMNPDIPELEDVSNAIKEIFTLYGIKAIRADDIEHSGLITSVILDKIQKSEFLIADLTGERPNVYYEIGFAHAINKRPILIRKTKTKLHFDLSVHNVPEYRNITELRELLNKRLEAITGKTI